MKRYQVDSIKIEELAIYLQNGAIMLYPTDTLPGIGCLGNNKLALDKLFAIKKRDASKPVSYAFSSFGMMSRYVTRHNFVDKFNKILPGKVTLVLPLKEKAPLLHGVNSSSLGCRIPQVDWLLDLISFLDNPIVTTSANVSGIDPVSKIEDVPKEILDQVDIIIEWPGEMLGVGSTVVDLSVQNEFKILREGAISKEQIESLILN